MIFDAAHGTALLHRDGQVRYLAMERYIPGTDETELDWQRMWKRFFKALTIEQRRDEKGPDEPCAQAVLARICEMQPDLAFPGGSCPQSGLKRGGLGATHSHTRVRGLILGQPAEQTLGVGIGHAACVGQAHTMARMSPP